MLFETKQRQVV